MNNLFNPATRTAELLQKRSREGQLEMLDTALDEGYATTSRVGRVTIQIEWHGINAAGTNVLEAIDNWITLALRTTGDAA
ncbi:MAG: hypothetical protein COB08_000710 [Rhodobacteraceae bacterium]|nr:hypothetical protein [Paracoccaceae bacterium]